MTNLFISHSSRDDALVCRLQQALADLGQDVWIDSRAIRGGDPLWLVIQGAIQSASAYAILVSPAALQSRWVGRELRRALAAQKERGRDRFPVIPLALDGTRLGGLEEFFGQEPAYIPVTSEPGGIETALHAILVALGKRLPTDLPPTPQTHANPLEELVLELTDPQIQEAEGIRRATARARLVYQPATADRRAVNSEHSWPLVAPLGPIEAEELRWYLEKYAIWPSTYFQPRADRVKQSLIEWGQRLYQTSLPTEHTSNVLHAWSRIDPHAGRRFSVSVDPTLESGASDGAQRSAREAATELLGLPWELLHDGDAYLFQGARPIRVRRRLPNTRVLDVPVVAPPIRILLVTARPEDDACGYIDHRASALPLVDAMEDLGGLVDLQLLEPPTLPALRDALQRAFDARAPYHVVHFDGHGAYDRRVGLGGLCFEDPQDSARLEQRRHQLVYTDELGPLLRDYGIPLVFLEACQTAQAHQASESVASELLKVGVASVVAMSHSVLVETARRFVLTFYRALAEGKRVGDAMLAGQRGLKDDSFRGRVFGVGEFRLEDWFVPVLFQGREDPQLFTRTHTGQTREDLRTALKNRLGELPASPLTGFIGRSRDLLALERLLSREQPGERWALIRGQGGAGKTALACELARWLVRSRRTRRAAFVSVETQGNFAAVLDTLGRQLVGKNYSVAAFPDPHHDLEQAILPIERALAEQPTLLIIDNLESILPPPYLAEQTPASLAEDAARELTAILTLCARLMARGETRLIFTSRETLPAPFDVPERCRELARLDREDAVRLVERVLDAAQGGQATDASDAARESIEALVEAVHAHARTLALLAPSLRALGVERTRADLTGLMAEMDRRFPGSRERSVFASVELSLRRMSQANRERVGVLGVFHGGVALDVLRAMMEPWRLRLPNSLAHFLGRPALQRWKPGDAQSLAADLIRTGLATADPYDHLTLNPALCPYLRAQLRPAELDALTGRWVKSMGKYVEFLRKQSSRQAEIAATLTGLELPNLFALLDRVQDTGDAESTIALATSLYSLLQWRGQPQLLDRVGEVRDCAASVLQRQSGDSWTHARFQVERIRILQQRQAGVRLRESLAEAEALLGRARAAGESAYPGADYDLAMACHLLARILLAAGRPESALTLLDESRQRFETIERIEPGCGAERMASVCLTERGECLRDLGRLDESAAAYEAAVALDERRGGERDIAVGKNEIGAVRLLQRRYPDALAAFQEARKRFARLDEPDGIAVTWHRTGMVYHESGDPESAEDAYRQSLAISVRLGDKAGQAVTLGQLGKLYGEVPNRLEDAAVFCRQCTELYVEIGDAATEGRARHNLSEVLRQLGRLDEARLEVQRAIDCKAQFGHASEPWITWALLGAIETKSGNPEAAVYARSRSVGAYLDYRLAGGENHDPDSRIALAIGEPLRTGNPAQARSLLAQITRDLKISDGDPDGFRPFLQSLDAICTGSRDPALADTPGLHYTMSAEILLLIETLQASSRPPP